MLAVMALFVLAACGEKSQEDVLGDIEDALEETTSYKAKAKMVLETGQEPQSYDVEVWQKDEAYYRVVLTNEANDQSQIILKNDEGVFVLTPALNKTFRFQSDWPKTNSQAYLYESLLHDILIDAETAFSQDENHYIFQTMTNYQNKNLNSQEVRLNKKDLSPATVKILNADGDVLVDLVFSEFEKNATLEPEDFATERNVTGAQISEPALAEQEEDGELDVLYPMYVPDGTTAEATEMVENEGGTSYVQQYTGDKSFTLIQRQSEIVPASTPMNMNEGEPVDLGFAIGVRSENQIMWSNEGNDFSLVSEELTEEEMVEVARSVYGTTEK